MEGSDGEKFDLTPDLQASKLCDGPLRRYLATLFNHPIREFDLCDQKLLSCLDLDILVLRVYVCHYIGCRYDFEKHT